MDKTSRFLLILVLVVSSSGLARAQAQPQKSDTETPTTKAKPKSERQKSAKEEPGKQWLERADAITLEIREEEWRLGRERTLLLARLAESWWKFDIKRARPWMESAVGELEFQPQNEDFEDAQARTALAESVLKIVMPLDRSYLQRLLKVVAEGVERAAKNANSAEEKRQVSSRLAMKLPDLMRDSARNQDLASADRIYHTLLTLKDGNDLRSALGNMRGVNRDYAGKLYAETLEAARIDYEPGIVGALAEVAYPRYALDQSLLPPEALRQRFLDLLSDGILRVPKNEDEQTRICNLWGQAERLLSNYPPDRMGAIQAVIEDCQRQMPAAMQRNKELDMNRDDPADYLKAGELEKTPWRKAIYKSRAANKAYENGDSLRALDIITSLTEEERGAYQQWVSDYQRYELDATEELYKRHDYPRLQQIMDNSPRRPQTLLTVAQMLFEQKDQSFGMTILSEARRATEKTQVDEPLFYWLLLHEYSQHVPSETAAILKEAVVGLNGIRPPPPDAKFYWTPLSRDFRSLSISPQLLDLEPQYVTATIKLLDSPQERTAFRLNLLRAALKRYERERAEVLQKQQTSPAKTKSRDTAVPSSN